MPTDNNTNLGFPPCFWLILRYAHGLYGKVLSRSRALSYSKNTTENLLATENAEISDDFWKRRTRLYFSYYKRAFFIKALKYRRFGNVRIIICWHTKNNLSQEGMAKILGVNQTTVGQWLNGKKKPGYDSILLLYEKFGVTPNELFGIDWTENCKKPRSRLFYS